MHKVKVSEELASKVPGIVLSCIECDVSYANINEELWRAIEVKTEDLNHDLDVEYISKIPTVAAMRSMYKKCGKDPARYRPSAEALLRRVTKRGKIYQVNNVVDQLNLVSLSRGFSIGGYDAEKIEGEITFGIGEENEPYEGIGRGALNIEFMPVFRDASGAFGTPTSDSVRTCVSDTTKRFLMIIIATESTETLEKATEQATKLLKKYAAADNFELETIKA